MGCSNDAPDPVPRWRAMFFIFVNNVRLPVLGDSGCSRSCMSEEYFRGNPSLKQSFVAGTSHGAAINGTDVTSLGEARLDFRLGDQPMLITCRVTKGLMDPIVLGWDWMYKYAVSMDAASGVVNFCNGQSVSLIEDDLPRLGLFYRVFEDLTLPAFSKVQADVELMHGNRVVVRQASTVVAEPFPHDGDRFCAARTCSKLVGNRFLTEFINPTGGSMKIPAGEVVGYAEIWEEDGFAACSVRTEMSCAFGDDTGLSERDNETSTHPNNIPTPNTPPPTPPHTQNPTLHPQPPCLAGYREDEGIPPGAKPLKVDLSEMAEDAREFEPQLWELLTVKHKEAFSRHDRDYGKTHLIQYRAHLKDPEQNPLSQPPYRTRPEMRDIIDQQAHEMIADGLVGHSQSSYSAPILLARKKCGGWRFLTDFRKVNECCTKVVYPLPRIEDSIQRLESPKYFSSMDLLKGFWQIPIHPDDRKYFAFSTESMHLEYLVAPMGAKNSPSYLSSLMQLVLRGLPIQHVVSYLDDILVADRSMEDHLHHLDQVLSALAKAGLKLNPKKCAFARDSVVCLGHKLSRDGVSPDPANVEKIKSWKAPDSAKKLRAFLGLTGYYRQFVKGYSEIARSLTDLTRDGVKWSWGPVEQKAFETLRDTLMSELVMAYPNFSLPFVVKADASLTAIGYVLTQVADGKERVISYGSKKLSQQQQRWSTYDREFFALIAAVRANAHYLRHARFTVVTDHRPLLAWRKVDARKDPTGRRTRWAIELDNYEFELIYKKGLTHCDADAMSRRGDDDDEIAEDPDEFLGLAWVGQWRDAVDDPATFMGMLEENEAGVVSLHADSEARARLRREQDADTIMAEVKGYVQKRKRLPREFPETWYKRNCHFLTVRDGILYRRSYAESVHADVLLAVIPDSMVPEILSDLHGSGLSGHPGVAKMLLQVRRFATWPTLPQDVKDKVKNCAVCDQLREQVPKPVTPLQPIVAKGVFDHVMCDLISFPTPSFGYKYVLVFKDVFSGFIRCYKLRDKTTKGVIRCFEDLVCLLGPPRVLSSDNGGEFVSGALKQACHLLHVEKRTSVPYRPQSQGNVERQNRTLIKDLQHRLVQHGKSWSEHLPYVEWHHNTTPYAKTRMTPYFIFFGREPYLPLFSESSRGPPVDAKDHKFVEALQERMKIIHDEAEKRAEEKRTKEAEQYNKKVKHAPLEPGDQVWERAQTVDKLEPRWTGPIRVKSRRRGPTGEPGTTYECERPDGTTCRRNYEQLKRVNARFEENLRLPVEKPSGLLKGCTDEICAIIFGDDPVAPPHPAQLPAAPPAMVAPLAVERPAAAAPAAAIPAAAPPAVVLPTAVPAIVVSLAAAPFISHLPAVAPVAIATVVVSSFSTSTPRASIPAQPPLASAGQSPQPGPSGWRSQDHRDARGSNAETSTVPVGDNEGATARDPDPTDEEDTLVNTKIEESTGGPMQPPTGEVDSAAAHAVAGAAVATPYCDGETPNRTTYQQLDMDTKLTPVVGPGIPPNRGYVDMSIVTQLLADASDDVSPNSTVQYRSMVNLPTPGSAPTPTPFSPFRVVGAGTGGSASNPSTPKTQRGSARGRGKRLSGRLGGQGESPTTHPQGGEVEIGNNTVRPGPHMVIPGNIDGAPTYVISSPAGTVPIARIVDTDYTNPTLIIDHNQLPVNTPTNRRTDSPEGDTKTFPASDYRLRDRGHVVRSASCSQPELEATVDTNIDQSYEAGIQDAPKKTKQQSLPPRSADGRFAKKLL